MNRFIVLAAALLLLNSGCNTGGVVPVSGRVTLDGKPLAGAHVSFQPLSGGGNPDPGLGSYAVTAADGAYSLKLAQGDRPGAAVGKHRVEIIMRNETDDDSDRQGKRPRYAVLIPARYNLRSELACEVPPGGKSDSNFDLKSK